MESHTRPCQVVCASIPCNNMPVVGCSRLEPTSSLLSVMSECGVLLVPGRVDCWRAPSLGLKLLAPP
eukprot:2936239-Lingulodinium_polyedra.AAC.1